MTQSTFLGSNISLVKAHNLRAILLHLLYGEGLSRVELAENTSLSTTTITNLITELLEQGIVVEEGAEQHQRDPRQIGRPRTALKLVPDAGYTVGVHIGIGLLRVAVTNLRAAVVCNRITSFSLNTAPETVVAQIGDEVELTMAQSGVDRQRMIGLGVGASGLVDPQTGVNTLAPTLGWHDVPIRDQLKARLGLPVTVDNNVRAMALGEALFGAGRGADVLAFVYGDRKSVV
jgi:hypothetical protein